MNYFIHSLIPIWVGISIWVIAKKYYQQRRYPYRWMCPRCGFKIKTNIKETFEISVSSHVHTQEKYDPDRDSNDKR
jgi:hypothetical protein